MRKIIAIGIGVVALFAALYSASPPYFPFESIEDIPVTSDTRCLEALSTADLNGDGIDEVIEIHNCGELAKKAAEGDSTLESVDLSQQNYVLVSNYGNKRTYGASEMSDPSKLGISGVIDRDGDGLKELFIQRSNGTCVELFEYPATFEEGTALVRVNAPARSKDHPWNPGISIFGGSIDSSFGGPCLLGKMCTGKGGYPRGIILFPAGGSSVPVRQYSMGAYPNTVDLIDQGGDGIVKVVVATDTPGNHSSFNGTNDSTAYVIALDRDLKEVWKVEVGVHCIAWAYLCDDVRNGAPRILTLTRYERGADSAFALVLDPFSKREMDKPLLRDLPAGAIPIFDERLNRRCVISGSMTTGKVIQYGVSNDRLTALRSARISNGYVFVFEVGDILGDARPEIGVANRGDNSIWVLGSDLKPLLRIESRGRSELQWLHAVRCADGERRLIYVDGPALVKSSIRKASRMMFVARTYWGLAAYALVVGTGLHYGRKLRPNAREGRLKLLEHLRVSLGHGELSIINQIDALVDTMKAIEPGQERDEGVVHHLDTLLSLRSRKWSNDLKSIVLLAGTYRLYGRLMKRIAPLVREIDCLLDQVDAKVKSRNPLDAKELHQAAEQLEIAGGELEKGLLAIQSDLESIYSTDTMHVLVLSLQSFRPEFDSHEINATCSIDQGGEHLPFDWRHADIAGPLGAKPLIARFPEDMFFTMIDNLLSNAVHAVRNASKKEIVIGVEGREHSIRISVRDTGYGIPARLLEEIFDKGVSTKGSSGTGLWYNRHVLDRFGGKIEVMSEGSGKGATFTVTVPRVQQGEGP